MLHTISAAHYSRTSLVFTARIQEGLMRTTSSREKNSLDKHHGHDTCLSRSCAARLVLLPPSDLPWQLAHIILLG